ncbi:uncharacterized protein BDV14DRAFT_198068 [Aspergillus stella-maris]|uniref:uncharacterized protein n=1 Tax=Aspergillus stella-maris TaxID=1810926 RepID=UPI003CCDA2B4
MSLDHIPDNRSDKMICDRAKPKLKPAISQHYNRLKPENPAVDIQFFRALRDGDGDICGFDDRIKQPRYYTALIAESSKAVGGKLKDGDRRNRCFLLRLPLGVRMRIYQYLFKHDFSALEIGRLKSSGVDVGNLAILRASHAIYHEASIALHHSLSYRKLFLRTFGSYSASLLTSFPRPLRSCNSPKPPLVLYALHHITLEDWAGPGP